MKRVLSSRNCRVYRMAASLPVALFVSSLLTAPMGLAADQHNHQGEEGHPQGLNPACAATRKANVPAVRTRLERIGWRPLAVHIR